MAKRVNGRNPIKKIEQVVFSNSPVPRHPLLTPTMRDGFAGSGSASTSEEDDERPKPIEQVGFRNSPVPRHPLVTPTMRDGCGSGSASTSEDDDDVLTSCTRQEMVNQHQISSPAF